MYAPTSEREEIEDIFFSVCGKLQVHFLVLFTVIVGMTFKTDDEV